MGGLHRARIRSPHTYQLIFGLAHQGDVSRLINTIQVWVTNSTRYRLWNPKMLISTPHSDMLSAVPEQIHPTNMDTDEISQD
jgi:hypothetical protein